MPTMKLREEKPGNPAKPRLGAEERVENLGAGARKYSAADADADAHKQLHELQVTRVELELQNAELIAMQLARQDVEAVLTHYTDLYDFAPVGYFTLDHEGVLCEVNLSGAQLIGEERVNLAGRLLRNYVAPNYRPTFNAFITKLFADHCTASCEVEFINARKRPFFAHLEANVDEAGNHCFIVVKDITGARIVDQAVERAHQELEDRVRERTAELVRANEQLTAEIAKRTQAEAALTQTEQMLRQLAAHQDLIKEEERKRIAREIHDDLGQNLLALRLDVSMLHARTGASHPKLNKRTAEALQQIDVTMKSVRSIINNLRPNTLDLGLTAAIEWQMADFQRRSRIDCQFIVDEKDFMADLDENLSAALFRIVQESLTNVIQHAQASKVVITLRRNEANLLMTVADNGVGFVPGRKRQATPFGLMGIRERVGRLGGDLVIDSGRGNGTTLAVSIPIPAAA